MTQRGDFVLAALQGDFGKVRPVLVVQNDQARALDSVTVCLVTSDLMPDTTIRIDVDPDGATGLVKQSQVQADKVQTIRRERIRARLGRASEEILAQVDLALAFHLALSAPRR